MEKKEKRPKENCLEKGGGERKHFDWDEVMKLTIEDYIDRRGLSSNVRNQMKSCYKRLKKFFEEKGIDSPKKITSRTAYDYATFLARENYFSNTRTTYLGYYKRLIKYLYSNKYIEKNFEKTIPKIKYEGRKNESKIWTDEELDRIVEVIKENENNIELKTRDIAITMLLREYGLRISDIINLKFENINWKNKKISIVQKKTKIALELPLTERVIEAINNYLDNGRHPSNIPNIFLSSRQDKSMGSGDYFIRLKMYSEMANIEYKDNQHHGTHSFRHTFATKLLKNEIPLPMIAAILGHESISPTSLYLNVDTEQLRECCLSLEVLKDGRNEIQE